MKDLKPGDSVWRHSILRDRTTRTIKFIGWEHATVRNLVHGANYRGVLIEFDDGNQMEVPEASLITSQAELELLKATRPEHGL